tara:strand:- start:2761 stop:4398 length:1638 start_codon:yes stop_codon:yes gene_type:complete
MAEQDMRYNVPTDYKSGLADVLTEAKNIYNTKKDLGYQTYEGERFKDFAPEELAAMTGISGLVGRGADFFDPAAELYKGQSQKFGDVSQSYMNPYMQSVVDVQKREAARDYEQANQNLAKGAASAGSFGGSRQAIVESEAGRNYSQKLGDIQTLGTAAAYSDAQKAFESQKLREKGAASGLTNLGQYVPQQELKEYTGLAGVGEAKRDMDNLGLDKNYADFMKQQNFPYETLDKYQSTLYGYPYQPYEVASTYRKPSGMSNFMNLVGTGAKLYGMSQGMPMKTGGQVAFDSEKGLSAMLQGGGTPNSNTNPSIFDSSTALNKSSLANMLMSSIANLNTSMTESQALQEKIANEKLARLDNTSGNMANFIGDALINAAKVDPRDGTFSALAQGAAQASEKLPNIQEEKYKIQQALLQGKMSAAEAKAKLAQLTVKGYTDIATLNAGKLDSGAYNTISKLVAGKYNVSFSEKNNSFMINGVPVDDKANKLILNDIRNLSQQFNDGVPLNSIIQDYYPTSDVVKNTNTVDPSVIKADPNKIDQFNPKS